MGFDAADVGDNDKQLCRNGSTLGLAVVVGSTLRPPFNPREDIENIVVNLLPKKERRPMTRLPNNGSN